MKLMSGRCRVAERSVILELEFIQTIEDDRGCVWGEKDEPADHQSTPQTPDQTRGGVFDRLGSHTVESPGGFIARNSFSRLSGLARSGW